MTWIKLDDKTPRHPKIASLSDRAFRWWFRGLCYASEFLTDGVLHPTFWKQAPKTSRAELSGNKLWIWNDPNFEIHGYLEHQQSRESVENERRRQRDRRKTDRGTADRRTPGTTAGTTPVRTDEIPRPPIEAEAEVDVPEKKNVKAAAGAPLIKSPIEYARAMERCAFVGAKIEVPKRLHAELRTKHGGADPEKELMEWYSALDEAAEDGNWRVPTDNGIFRWLKDHHAKQFPPTPVNGAKKSFDEELDEWARS